MIDYNKTRQRFHKFPASDGIWKIVHEAITMDALLGTGWPMQWSSPEAPELHDVLARVHAASFKVLVANLSGDSRGADFTEAIRALEFFLRKINEHPGRYRIIRTTPDITGDLLVQEAGFRALLQGVEPKSYLRAAALAAIRKPGTVTLPDPVYS